MSPPNQPLHICPNTTVAFMQISPHIVFSFFLRHIPSPPPLFCPIFSPFLCHFLTHNPPTKNNMVVLFFPRVGFDLCLCGFATLSKIMTQQTTTMSFLFCFFVLVSNAIVVLWLFCNQMETKRKKKSVLFFFYPQNQKIFSIFIFFDMSQHPPSQ